VLAALALLLLVPTLVLLGLNARHAALPGAHPRRGLGPADPLGLVVGGASHGQVS
jgi:hypothetical protein